jgi:uncharacterized protein (TIGR02246 family)
MTSANAVSPRPSADDAIMTALRGYCDAWNRHDMKAMADLFDDDAQWVNIVGMYWPGRAAVVAGHEAFHRTFFQTTEIEMTDAEIKELAPSVATAVILLKVGAFTPPDGIPRPKSDNRLSLVLTRRSGRWRIAHGHNTVIDPAAQPFDPVETGWPKRG